MTIRFANSHIQIGKIAIMKSSEDDPTLKDSRDFTTNNTAEIPIKNQQLKKRYGMSMM